MEMEFPRFGGQVWTCDFWVPHDANSNGEVGTTHGVVQRHSALVQQSPVN